MRVDPDAFRVGSEDDGHVVVNAPDKRVGVGHEDRARVEQGDDAHLELGRLVDFSLSRIYGRGACPLVKPRAARLAAEPQRADGFLFTVEHSLKGAVAQDGYAGG